MPILRQQIVCARPIWIKFNHVMMKPAWPSPKLHKTKHFLFAPVTMMRVFRGRFFAPIDATYLILRFCPFDALQPFIFHVLFRAHRGHRFDAPELRRKLHMGLHLEPQSFSSHSKPFHILSRSSSNLISNRNLRLANQSHRYSAGVDRNPFLSSTNIHWLVLSKLL